MSKPLEPMRGWARCLAVAAVFAAQALGAQGLPSTTAESVGMSSERLARIGTWMQAEVDAGRVPGAVVMVARDGKLVYFTAAGKQDPARPDPMRSDTIFRIYSMSKPIVAAAAMMLVEEGKLQLNAPVSRYIPSFANVRVGVEKIDPATGAKSLELVPARRAMTVQDLLRHTSGITYGVFGTFGNELVEKAYRDAGVASNVRSADPAAKFTTAELAEKLAALPLSYQPGSTWNYGFSTDVLGRVLEVATGQSLYTVLRTRLLDPLGMKDTSFFVTEPARQARIAEALPDDVETATIRSVRVPHSLESGGGGLVSTAQDYARFLQMMLAGGVLEGRRYLSPKTIEYMASDHLGTAVAPGSLYLPGPGYGFGLGFAVRKSAGEAPSIGSPGEYYWGGGGGTYMWVDPKTRLFAILMMQAPRRGPEYQPMLRNLVYAAVLN